MGDILLVSRDLLARSRIENATLGSGADVVVVDSDRLSTALRESAFRLVIVDLDAVGTMGLERVRHAREEGILPARVVGYFSHVDEDLGKAAELAGCEAIPRGRFWRTLPEILSEETEES